MEPRRSPLRASHSSHVQPGPWDRLPAPFVFSSVPVGVVLYCVVLTCASARVFVQSPLSACCLVSGLRDENNTRVRQEHGSSAAAPFSPPHRTAHAVRSTQHEHRPPAAAARMTMAAQQERKMTGVFGAPGDDPERGNRSKGGGVGVWENTSDGRGRAQQESKTKKDAAEGHHLFSRRRVIRVTHNRSPRPPRHFAQFYRPLLTIDCC